MKMLGLESVHMSFLDFVKICAAAAICTIVFLWGLYKLNLLNITWF